MFEPFNPRQNPTTKLSLRRSPLSYSKVQSAIATLIRGRRFHLNHQAIASKQYLDVGCGPNTHPDFINLDYSWHPGIDVCWDITQGLPLKNEQVRGIFTEHCLEHITLQNGYRVLEEFWRVLKPSGHIRIVVPDGELYLSRYTSLMRGQSSDPLPYSENENYRGLYTPMLSVNRIFRDHGHAFIYDFETLKSLLQQIGFIDLKKETYMSGRAPKLLKDTEHRQIESLYIEATKPG